MKADSTLQGMLHTAKFVGGAFIVSPFLFLVVAIIVAPQPVGNGLPDMVVAVLGIVGVANLAFAEFVPALVVRAIRPKTLSEWLQRNFLKWLIETAIRESAAVLAFVIYFLSPEDVLTSLSLFGLVVIFMVLRFPNKKRMTADIPPELLREGSSE